VKDKGLIASSQSLRSDWSCVSLNRDVESTLE
jgi:hypothetical protein